jgi:hypothetical protein
MFGRSESGIFVEITKICYVTKNALHSGPVWESHHMVEVLKGLSSGALGAGVNVECKTF